MDGGVSVESLKSKSSSFVVELLVEPTTAFAVARCLLRRFQKKRNAIASIATTPTGTTTATAIFEPPCKPPDFTESELAEAVAGERVVVEIGSVSPGAKAVTVDVYTRWSFVRVSVLTCLLRRVLLLLLLLLLLPRELVVDVASVLEVHSDDDDEAGEDDAAVEDGGALVELGSGVDDDVCRVVVVGLLDEVLLEEEEEEVVVRGGSDEVEVVVRGGSEEEKEDVGIKVLVSLVAGVDDGSLLLLADGLVGEYTDVDMDVEDQSSDEVVATVEAQEDEPPAEVVGYTEDVELSTRKSLLGKTGLFMHTRTWHSAVRFTYCRSWTLFIRGPGSINSCQQRENKICALF